MIFEELAQSPLTHEISFEKVVEVLKKAGGNASLAKELLTQIGRNSDAAKVLAASSQFEDLTIKNADDDEDLYD